MTKENVQLFKMYRILLADEWNELRESDRRNYIRRMFFAVYGDYDEREVLNVISEVRDTDIYKWAEEQDMFDESNDEISEQEFEARTKQLLDNGEDFLDYEESASDKVRDTGRSLKQKLAYYSLPLTIIAAFAIPILLPNVSPMVAIVATPTILTIAVIVWGYFKLRSVTSDW